MTATGNVPNNDESASVACGCGPQCDDTRPKEGDRTLPIVWQRLVADGATCPRCESTGTEVEQAVATLADVLRPLGIEPTLEIRAIAQAEFDAAPGDSNKILIGDRPLEAWIGATVGASRCCSVCGSNDCRTVEVDGTTFETVPGHLIVKAGLIAAAALVNA